MRAGDAQKLVAGFRKRDIEHFLAEAQTFRHELHGESRLAGTRLAFEKIHMAGGEPAAKNLVKACASGAGPQKLGVSIFQLCIHPVSSRTDHLT